VSEGYYLPVEAAVAVSATADIARLEQLLRDKDDMLAAQFRELTECRRHLAMAQEGITHWRARALAAEDQP
jgi:hypothetical protein